MTDFATLSDTELRAAWGEAQATADADRADAIWAVFVSRHSLVTPGERAHVERAADEQARLARLIADDPFAPFAPLAPGRAAAERAAAERARYRAHARRILAP